MSSDKFPLPLKKLTLKHRLAPLKPRNKQLSYNHSLPSIFTQLPNASTVHTLFFSQDEATVKHLKFNPLSNKLFCDNDFKIRFNIDNNVEAIRQRHGIKKKITPEEFYRDNGNADSNSNSNEEVAFKNENTLMQTDANGNLISHVEKKFMDKLTKDKNEMNVIKEHKCKVENEIVNITKQIDDINFDLTLLDNGSNLFTTNKLPNVGSNGGSSNSNNDEDGICQTQNESSNRKLKSNNTNNNTNMNKLNMFIIKTLQAQEMKTKVKKRMQLQTTKDDLTIKLSKLKTELTDIKTKFTQSKLKITETTSQLMDHYKQLLYEGLDVRTEGLTWIIKAMWNLGEDVPIEFFPSFLDFNAVDYLFTVAHKSIEINKLNEKINMIKRGLRESMLLSQDNNVIESKRTEKIDSSSSKTDEFFRTSIFPIKNKRMIKALSMSNIYIPQKKEKNNNELTIKQINLMIQNSKKKLNDNVLSYVDKLEELNLQKKNIELELINLKNNEMNRIFKEFMENDYQRRFDVVIEVVVAALVGSIKKHAELVKIAKKKRQYKEDMQQIRFFNVAAFHPKSKAKQLEKQLKKQSL